MSRCLAGVLLISIMLENIKKKKNEMDTWFVFEVLDVRLFCLDDDLTFAVCFDQVEQMNKKVDLTRRKKTIPTEESGTFLQKAPTKNRCDGMSRLASTRNFQWSAEVLQFMYIQGLKTKPI